MAKVALVTHPWPGEGLEAHEGAQKPIVVHKVAPFSGFRRFLPLADINSGRVVVVDSAITVLDFALLK